MHHVLRYSSNETQRDYRKNDFNRSFEYKSKDASEADYEKDCPGKAILACDGSNVSLKSVHRTLSSVKPKVAIENVWEGRVSERTPTTPKPQGPSRSRSYQPRGGCRGAPSPIPVHRKRPPLTCQRDKRDICAKFEVCRSK